MALPQVRSLGLISSTGLVIASMIGAGVFTTTGFLLADLKSAWLVLAAWAVGGALAAFGALSYGALARRIPESGGEYLFLSRTLHPAAGYLAGWISLLVGFTAPAAMAAFAFGAYAKPWFPAEWQAAAAQVAATSTGGWLFHPWIHWPQKLVGTILLITFSVVHALHVQRGAWLQNMAVAVKILLIVLFVGLAAGRLDPANGSTFSGPFPVSTFGVSLVWISFSYAGWNAAIYIGGEVRDPERNLPRALLLGTGIVTVLYLMLNAVFVFSAPTTALAGKLEVGQLSALALGGPWWAQAVTGLILLALVTSVSSLVMAGPRVYARMAADGYLPAGLATREGPPRAAIALQTGLALLLLWTASYENLLTYMGFTLGLSTAATVAGLVALRRKEGAALPVPGWPWVPALFLVGVIGSTVFTFVQRPTESRIGLLTIAVGWMVWRLTAGRRRRP